MAMLLVLAKKGVFVLEQPSTSLAFRLRGFQEILRKTKAICLQICLFCLMVREINVGRNISGYGHAKVYKQSFWMRGWGSRTPKRTTLWANSTAIRYFSTTEKALGLHRKGSYKLADTYTDALGRKRFKGNKRLRKSQNLASFNVNASMHALSFDAI